MSVSTVPSFPPPTRCCNMTQTTEVWLALSIQLARPKTVVSQAATMSQTLHTLKRQHKELREEHASTVAAAKRVQRQRHQHRPIRTYTDLDERLRVIIGVLLHLTCCDPEAAIAFLNKESTKRRSTAARIVNARSLVEDFILHTPEDHLEQLACSTKAQHVRWRTIAQQWYHKWSLSNWVHHKATGSRLSIPTKSLCLARARLTGQLVPKPLSVGGGDPLTSILAQISWTIPTNCRVWCHRFRQEFLLKTKQVVWKDHLSVDAIATKATFLFKN